MQAAFKKIIEKLEERTSFLSDCTKYGNKDAEQQNKSYSTMMMYEVADLVDDLIEIVKQEAADYEECYKDCGDCEAYNKEKYHCPKFCKVIKETVKEIEENHNGWIPCNERLPEEAFGCLVTVMDCNPSTQTDFENILPYFVGYDGDSWNDADGEEIPFEVLAWRKLPLPYQPKGE